MAYLKYLTLCALPVALAMTLSAAPQPAAAQTAENVRCNGCVNSRDIRNNGIKSRDMKPNISLGTGSNDGDFSVKDTTGATTVSLDGDTGDVTNSLAGNGLVKAWARLNANGTVISCFRCNTDPAQTRQIGTGIWEVDFTPLGTDISSRPRMCTSEIFTPGAPGPNTDDNICNTSTSTDLSTVNVRIWDGGVTPNTPESDQFTVIIF